MIFVLVRVLAATFFLVICAQSLIAQRVVGQDTLYGHEWIVPGNTYARVSVAEGGLYQITAADLAAYALDACDPANLQLFYMGEQIALHVQAAENGAAKRLLFHVDEEPALAYERTVFSGVRLQDMLSPDYRMFSDSLVLYLTCGDAPGRRWELLPDELDDSAVSATSGIVEANGIYKRNTLAKVKDSFGGSYSSYRAFEGWATPSQSNNRVNFSTPNAVRGLAGELRIRTLSSIVPDHQLEIIAEGENVFSEEVGSNSYRESLVVIPASVLSNSSIKVSVIGRLGSVDRHSVGLAKLTYERVLTLGRRESYLEWQPTTTSSSDTWKFAAGVARADTLIAFNISSGRGVLTSNALTGFSLPAAGDARLIAAKLGVLPRAAMRPAKLGERIASNTNYLIVNSAKQASWETTAADYAAFRSSAAGGGYRVQVVEVEKLYESYGYGIQRNPLALRAAIQEGAYRGSLKQVLIIGKGRELDAVRTEEQVAKEFNESFFVPTMGVPGSDVLLTYDPLNKKLPVALGRLAVSSSEQLERVLAKARNAAAVGQLPQTFEDKFWTKRLIHLVGGGNANEQAQFSSIMDDAASRLATSDFAAAPVSYYKDSDAPVQEATSTALFDNINDGAVQMTYLGHGSQGSIGYNVDNPTRYENAGRLPVFFALGCYTGNMFDQGLSLGERFVVGDDDIAVAFGAGVGLGYPSILGNFLDDYYEQIGTLSYGQGIGEALRIVQQDLLRTNSRLLVQQGEQFLLQGDPAVTLSTNPGPDYVIDEASAVFTPRTISSAVDSFTLSFELTNLGLNLREEVRVEVRRGSETSSARAVDTTSILMDVSQTQASVRLAVADGEPGLNYLTLRILDEGQQLPRPAAIQNDITNRLTFVVVNEAVEILYPYEASRITDARAVVYASGGSPFAALRTYEWQLSTDPGYPFGTTTVRVEESGSLPSWDVTDLITPEQPVFVRIRDVRKDSAWSEVAFTYAGGTATLKHALHLDEDRLFDRGPNSSLAANGDDGWQFARKRVSHSLINKEYDQVNRPAFRINLDVPNVGVQPWLSLRSGVAVLVLDGSTGKLPPFGFTDTYGSQRNGPFNSTFLFPAETVENQALVRTVLEDYAKNGDYVFFFSVYRAGFELPTDELKAAEDSLGNASLLGYLRNQGAERLNEWADLGTVPYTLYYRKGDANSVVEEVGQGRGDQTETDIFLEIAGNGGTYTSPTTPFVDSLRSVKWSIERPTTDTTATVVVRLLSIDALGQISPLLSAETWSGTRALDLAGAANTRYYLEVEQSNGTALPPGAINELELAFRPLPDLVYDSQVGATAPGDTLELGVAITTTVGVRNVSPTAVRPELPVLASVSVVDRPETLSIDTLGSGLAGFETLLWESTIAAPEGAGVRSMIYQLDPLEAVDELRESNNIASIASFIAGDAVSPFLHVFAEGEPMRSGVLLPVDPLFTFRVVDAGDSRALTNVARITIQLTTPDGSILSGASLPGEVRNLAPTKSNTASWEYTPGELAAGEYVLTVLAFDGSGNASSAKELRLEFEVDDRQAISAIVPYPNPMVDRVRFHYELTGRPPVDYRLNIYSVSGRLVRSLSIADLGPLRVGKRLTDGFWDGTTEHGDRLAAGTYLYKMQVAANDRDEVTERRETALDKWSKNGFGKLVILPR